MVGWAISIGCGAVAGLIIGLIYRLLNDNFNEAGHFFNDGTLFEYPKVVPQNQDPVDAQVAAGNVPESRKAL